MVALPSQGTLASASLPIQATPVQRINPNKMKIWEVVILFLLVFGAILVVMFVGGLAGILLFLAFLSLFLVIGFSIVGRGPDKYYE